MTTARLRGIVAAAATPLHDDRTIDLVRLVSHCRNLLDQGCHGINLLGTTGEATSFTLGQRLTAMSAVAGAGLPLDRFMVGTGAASIDDAITLTRAARDLNFAGALLLPPFYYKPLDNAALVSYVGTLIENVGRQGLRLYLYHYPALSGVPYPVEVVQTLKRLYEEELVGLKDSSGDLEFSATMAAAVRDFDVFPSAEGAIGMAKEKKFAGVISATANITAPFARSAWDNAGTEQAKDDLAKAVALRAAISSVPLVAGVKHSLSNTDHYSGWRRMKPPLRPLNAAEEAKLMRALADLPTSRKIH